MIGHAGTGKTTALTAVRAAYEGAGWQVLGTSTSEQAARGLEAEADVPSRTLASLRWQADRGRISFGRKTAIILDEAGMADDPDLLWLLGQVATAGGRLIMVGDHRQLDAVGPGGGLRAIIERGDAHHLDEVIRQANPAERRALDEVRDGDPAVATAFYRSHHRIHPLQSWEETVSAATDAWAGEPKAHPELTAIDLLRLVDAVPARFRTVVLLAGVLGLRWGEIAGLRLEDVDFLRRQVHVRRQLAELAGAVTVQETKSERGHRSLAAPTFVIEALAVHVQQFRSGAGRDDPLFTGPQGGLLRRNFLACVLRPPLWRSSARRLETLFRDETAGGQETGS